MTRVHMTSALALVVGLSAPTLAQAQVARTTGVGCHHPGLQAAVDDAALMSGDVTIFINNSSEWYLGAVTIDASVALWDTLTFQPGDTSCNSAIADFEITGDSDGDLVPDSLPIEVRGMTALEMDAGRVVMIQRGRIGRGTTNLLVDSASVRMTGGRLTNGLAPSHGGGLLAVNDARVVLDNVSVLDNEAGFGGGVAARSNAEVSLVGTTLIDRDAATSRGGGLYADTGAEVLLDDGVIIDNSTADESGGGIAVESGALVQMAGLTEVRNCSAPGVTGPGLGGGVYVDQAAFQMSEEAAVHTNTADWGGGIFARGQTASVVAAGKASVRDNTADAGGGGIAARAQASVTLTGSEGEPPQSSPAAVWAMTVTGNTSWADPLEPVGHGGGLYVDSGASLNTTAITILANTAVGPPVSGSFGFGGGLYVRGATAILEDTGVQQNVADEGGGLFVDDGADVMMTGNPRDMSIEGEPCALAMNDPVRPWPSARACSELYGNMSDGRGSAVVVDTDGLLTADDTGIRRNEVQSSRVPSSMRAPVWIEPDGVATFKQCLVADNGAPLSAFDPRAARDDTTDSVVVLGLEGIPGRFHAGLSTFAEDGPGDAALPVRYTAHSRGNLSGSLLWDTDTPSVTALVADPTAVVNGSWSMGTGVSVLTGPNNTDIVRDAVVTDWVQPGWSFLVAFADSVDLRPDSVLSSQFDANGFGPPPFPRDYTGADRVVGLFPDAGAFERQ